MIEDKEKTLREIVRNLGSAAVAFSGGADSALLLSVCRDELGERCAAVTIRSEIHPPEEYEAARKLAESLGARSIVIDMSALDTPAFAHNPPDRCYYCKRDAFTLVREAAEEAGLAHVLDGTNADDLLDYRPGQKAAEELGVRQPLREAGLAKAEIRELSKKLGLPTWDRPAQACLATRIPYGEPVTAEALKMIEAGEACLRGLGARQCRVRHHGNIARIELPPEDVARFAEKEARAALVAKFKEIGYEYVTLDLEGYRAGSMNEAIKT